jgi:hypothetical protein
MNGTPRTISPALLCCSALLEGWISEGHLSPSPPKESLDERERDEADDGRYDRSRGWSGMVRGEPVPEIVKETLRGREHDT